MPNKQYSGHSSATEIEGDQRTTGKEIWRKKEMGTAGFRYSWKKMEPAAAAHDRADNEVDEGSQILFPTKLKPMNRQVVSMLQQE